MRTSYTLNEINYTKQINEKHKEQIGMVGYEKNSIEGYTERKIIQFV